LHTLQVVLELFFTFHVLHDIGESDDGNDGDTEFLFNFLNGRELAILTSFLTVDQLEDTD
jgi:hypothetical protein